MALKTYRQKRNFTRTEEPRGAVRSRRPGYSYVIQKHDARRLHYDFRLEMDGVLKSWAVTRGPSLVSGEKRLAVQVEDHPLEYGDFEGTIPKGEYGGGTVIVWDRGRWTPIGDAEEGLAKGHLDFDLAGEKPSGRWHLIRMKGDNWLLIKGEDAAARAASARDILDEAPRSVKTGRMIEQVAGEDPGWSSTSGKIKNLPSEKRARRPAGPRHAISAAATKQRFKLTHPDRVYWPDAGVTKAALADYYASVWSWIAPFLVDRPLALLRCPDGVGGHCFFQKHAWQGLGAHIRQRKDAKSGPQPLLLIRDLEGLIELVQAGVLEIHPWGSTIAALERPDQIVMDLDPGPDVEWRHVIEAAHEVRRRFAAAGLSAFAKMSGGKGLHVVAPLQPRADWDAIKTFSKSVADEMAADSPDRYVSTVAKSKRRGKVLLDYLRNARGATAVAPYATRARSGAPVAMPVDWDQVRPDLKADQFTVTNIAAYLAGRASDPWAEFRAAAVPLSDPPRRLASARGK